jgi:hypothetical protein
MDTPTTPRPPGRPPWRRPDGALGRAYAFLVSPKLAIALLVGVLACCLVGVTVFRGERAWRLIFSTLWFNALLVLLALSSFAAFISRTWKRRLTVVQVGMILFHVSFAALLGGVVYNGLYRFKGAMRITEGETLRNADLASYDAIEQGRLFDYSRLPGETTLIRVHRDYKVGGANKRAAYELAVGEGGRRKEGFIYITEYFDYEGLRYFCSKEGYSVLVLMSGTDGRELYGGHLPLQSLKQPGGGYLYATGSSHGVEPFLFPAPPAEPRGELVVTYRPNSVVDRAGDVGFQFRPLAGHGAEAKELEGVVPVGGRFEAGDYAFSPREIRYWVGMDVRYDPGLNVILGSLVTGLVGMALTFVGRVRQGSARKRAA